MNYDSLIIQHDPMDAYMFTGIEGIEAAHDHMYAHCTRDFQHTAIFTHNEDGNGSRADADTIWFVFTTESLPNEFFTKVELTAEGIQQRDAMRAAKAQEIADSLAKLAELEAEQNK
jgi:hypothetical protein